VPKPWPELVARSVWDLPAKELSGLVYETRHERILAVGDSAATLLSAPWLGDRLGEWTEVDLRPAGVSGKGSQLEAVGIGPDGSVIVATESPATLFFLDDEGGCQRRIDLTAVAGAGDLVGGGSSIEGMAASFSGGLLLAREKRPVLLADLRPDGRGEVVASWPLGGELADALEDVSDLERSTHGLWLLSDQSATIARITAMPPPGEPLTAGRIARLPDLDGKPEGLAVLPDGKLLVGLDRKRARDNLVLLESPGW
jgi:hypothetical protein